VQSRYQLGNLQGSATLEFDDTAALLGYEEYFPYGGSTFIAGDDLRAIGTKEFRFFGAERDDPTGLYHFGHRYYAPWIGRWISPDPIGPADCLNLYTFCVNNPISFHDPDGLTSTVRTGITTPTPAGPTAGGSPTRTNVGTELRRSIAALNARRSAEGRPVTSVYLGLHIGDVFYGNIGSDERLDFTVVGPAVNEVARTAAMCRSVERTVLLSQAFAVPLA
jgi:RHS repeat-associated protein